MAQAKHGMTTLTERVSSRSLDFANQRKAYLLRTVQKQKYEQIAAQVVNLEGNHPSWGHVRDVCNGFSVARGCKPYKYHKSGRKPWKLTSEVRKYILKRLRQDRQSQVVTSTGLAESVARDQGVVVEASCIRKFLRSEGYQWLPRRQKRQYSKEQRAIRIAFCKAVLRLSKAALRKRLSMSLDGVVLSMPPTTLIERINYCWAGVTHMWRKAGEGNCKHLAGGSDYDKQVPLSRALPLWGGLSEGGFAPVVWTARKKTNGEEWAAAIRAGSLSGALQQISPRAPGETWTVLCDNETFLRSRVVQGAYEEMNIQIWDVPAKSPDLNPIEMFWGWLRAKLRRMDLQDLKQKRKPLAKAAYKQRVQKVLKSKKAQDVAKACARKFRVICKAVAVDGTAYGDR